jgi:hypothetical protein
LNKNKFRSSELLNVTKGKNMKKMILTGILVLALAGASLQSARAGDREWATVGKVLTGVAVAGLIVAATDGHAQANVSYTSGSPAYCPPPAPPRNYYPAPPPPAVYCPPPVVIAPAPVVVYRTPAMVYPAHYRWNNGYGYRHERW